MRFDFYLRRARRDRTGSNDWSWSDDWSDDDGPDILRVDNCSEVDVAGSFYKLDGKYYDDCCDLQSEDAPECQTISALAIGIWIGIVVFFVLIWCCCACNLVGNWFRSCFTSCANAFCQQIVAFCCERQTPIRNDNNTTRYSTERPNYIDNQC